METLPVEVLGLILEDAVQTKEDFGNISLVCKVFRDVLKNHLLGWPLERLRANPDQPHLIPVLRQIIDQDKKLKDERWSRRYGNSRNLNLDVELPPSTYKRTDLLTMPPSVRFLLNPNCSMCGGPMTKELYCSQCSAVACPCGEHPAQCVHCDGGEGFVAFWRVDKKRCVGFCAGCGGECVRCHRIYEHEGPEWFDEHAPWCLECCKICQSCDKLVLRHENDWAAGVCDECADKGIILISPNSNGVQQFFWEPANRDILDDEHAFYYLLDDVFKMGVHRVKRKKCEKCGEVQGAVFIEGEACCEDCAISILTERKRQRV